MSSVISAKKSVTISGAIVSVNAIKTTIATVAGAASYSGSGLNGSIGHTVMSLPRRITATLATHTGSYTDQSTITLTGLDSSGVALVEALTIAGTDGGTTLTSVGFFTQITKIDILAQVDTSGSFQFGISDVLVNCAQLRVGTSGDMHLQYGDGSTDTIKSVQIGESVPVAASILFGDSTVQNVTVYKV